MKTTCRINAIICVLNRWKNKKRTDLYRSWRRKSAISSKIYETCMALEMNQTNFMQQDSHMIAEDTLLHLYSHSTQHTMIILVLSHLQHRLAEKSSCTYFLASFRKFLVFHLFSVFFARIKSHDKPWESSYAHLRSYQKRLQAGLA